ncbi:hypothetical protein PF011_g24599 [Phytophthora fragariae]|uniref:PiggyBac transposable element-derived protein 4 C-terminal zinc-ribbon domain-containing protein n=1 Tax=Phytophthora fragariae TaxID=53985 RepID=A0A6A3I4K9_9STRA|nr:hypothetical protein PF011_g24599 [Phytophthora fragariae]
MKSFATTFFCERCSIDNAKCWHCNKIRRDYKGVAKTCFEIWHDDFGAGQDIPASLGKRVVLRRPGKNAGKHKKTHRELQLPRAKGSDCGDSDSESNDESVLLLSHLLTASEVCYDIASDFSLTMSYH